MSVRLLGKVFSESEARLASRLVLLALADSAGDDGVTWVGQQVIADKSRVHLATAMRCIGELVSIGELEVRRAQRGQKRINVYRVTAAEEEVDYDRLPFELTERFGTTSQITTSYPVQDDLANCEVAASQIVRSPISKGPVSGTVRGIVRGPTTVDGAPVLPAELATAHRILDHFNERTESRFKANRYLATIIMRLREHPEVDLEAHKRIIDRALEDPWWKGAPDPRVVYGNDAQFERSMHTAASPPQDGERPLTGKELDDYGITWGPGTQYRTPKEARDA